MRAGSSNVATLRPSYASSAITVAPSSGTASNIFAVAGMIPARGPTGQSRERRSPRSTAHKRCPFFARTQVTRSSSPA